MSKNLKDNGRGKKKMNVINITTAKQKLEKNITDSEINALFMGLIKIVKSSAMQRANEELKQECIMATSNFRQSLIDLQQKEREVKQLSELNEKLTLKIEKQHKQICGLLEKLSARKVSCLEKQSKKSINKLKNFDKTVKEDNIL